MFLMIDVYYLGIAVLLIWSGLFVSGLKQYSKENFKKSLAFEEKISHAIRSREEHFGLKRYRENLAPIIESSTSSDVGPNHH